jgi:glutamine synthetase
MDMTTTGPGVPEGMLTRDALREAVGRDEIDTVIVGFTDHYGRLVGKRYDAGMFAKAAFGQQVVDHYAHFFRTEWEAYSSAVSDWERRRYFERI